MRLSQSGQRLRAPLVDGPYGTKTRDWNNPLAPVTYECELQPLSSNEQTDAQERVEGRWTLFLPAGADVRAADRWVQEGVTYEVDAEPERWSYRNASHHLEARLSRVTGG